MSTPSDKMASLEIEKDEEKASFLPKSQPPAEAKTASSEGEASFSTQAFWLLVWMAK
jgi:hypothetical protein